MKRFFKGTALFAVLAGLMLYAWGCGGGAGINSVVTTSNSAGTSGAATTFVNETPDELTANTAADIGADIDTVTTFNDGTAASAAVYEDMATCAQAACHKDTYDSFLTTNHSLAWNKKAVLKRQDMSNKSYFEYYLGLGTKYCINCHTVNLPFDDANDNHAYDAGETVAFGMSATRPTYADYTAVPAEYQGIQCENCHGPASLHTPAGDANKISGQVLAARASTCGYCHGQVEEWTKSKHSITGLNHAVDNAKSSGSCGGCHTGDGFRRVMADTQSPKDYCASGYQGVNKSTDCVAFVANTSTGNGHNGITCTACHDPHSKNVGEHQLRATASDLCGKCHNMRYRKYYSTSTSATTYDKVPGASRGPHMAGQLEIQMGGSTGNGAVEPTTGTAVTNSYGYSTNKADIFVKYAFINKGPTMGATSCVDCHMYSYTNRSAGIEWLGHTFKVMTQACESCHSTMNAASVIGAKQARFKEKEEALNTRYKAMLTGLSAVGTSSSCPENSPDYMCCNALTTGSTTRDYCALIEYNVRIMEIDRSEGVHNEAYINAIYEATDSMLTSLGY